MPDLTGIDMASAPPDVFLDPAVRALWLADLDTYGTSCVCGTEASDVELDDYIDVVRAEVEPVPWVCQTCVDTDDVDVCDDCGWTGHEAGTSTCPWEVA